MAITDNNFTAEELRTAVTTTPDLANIIRGFALENETVRKAIEPDIIGPITRRHAEEVEKSVEELTGIKKEKDEKYYDYMKRAVGSRVKALTDELTTLKENPNPSKADKDRIEALEKALNDEKTARKNETETFSKKFTTLRASNMIDGAIDKLSERFLKTLPKTALDAIIKSNREIMIAELQFQQDDAPTFIDGDGKLRQNKEYKPLSVDEYAEQLFSEILEEKKQKGGAGSGGDDSGANPPADSKYVGKPANVKTKVQLTEHLLSLGIMQGTKEFDEIFAKDGKDLPLR